MKKNTDSRLHAFLPLLEKFVLGVGSRLGCCVAAVLTLAVLALPATAANLYWVGTNASATVGSPSDGNWDAATLAWDGTTGDSANTTNSVYVIPSTAILSGTGSYTATLTANLTGDNYLYINGGTPTVAGAFSIKVKNTLSVQVANGVAATIRNTIIDANSGTYTVGESAGTPAGTLILTNGAAIRSSNSGYGVAIDGNGTLIDVFTGCMVGNSSGGTGNKGFAIAASAGATCTVQVDGGAASVAGVNQPFQVGGGGNGILTLNSGTVSMPSGSANSLILGTSFGSTGTVDLNGGTMSVSNIIKFLGDSAIFNFNGGTLKANQNCAAFMTGLDAANVLSGGAVINNNGKTITIGQALLNGTNGTDGGLTSLGSGTLILSGANTYNGPTTLSAGKLVITTDSTGGGAFSLADGTTLEVQVNTPGTSLTSSSLTLGTSGVLTCNFTLGGNASTTIPAVADAGALNLNGTVTVNVTASGLGGSSTNVLLSYDSLTGSGSFVPGTLPTVSGSTVTLVNDIVNKQLELVVISTPASVQWAVGNGNWDTTTSNWQPLGGGSPTTFAEYAYAAFNDSASGGSPITVTLTGDHTPSVVNNSSTNIDYILAGSSYNLTGAGLVKDGPSTLTLDNGSGNSFSTITINDGTVQVGSGDTGGSLGATAVNDNGLLAFNRTDNPTFANAISGSGGVTQKGSGTVTLSGANSYSGLTTVANGQLILGNSAAAQNSVVSNNVANGLGFANGIINATVGGLAGAGNITLTNAASATVKLTAGGTSSLYDGSLSGGTLAKAGAGTLTLTANSAVDSLTVGNAASGGTLQVANGATLSVGSGTNSSLLIGISDGSARTGTLDVSTAASLMANVGTFQVGYAAGSGTGQGILNLATNNAITAGTAFSVARSDGVYNNVNSTVTTPGGSTTIIQTPAMAIGDGKGRGFFTVGSGATLNMAGVSGGRTALSVGSTSVFGGSGPWSGSLDASAGIFNGSLSSLVVGLVNADGNSSQTESATMALGANEANHLDISGAGNVVMVGHYQLGTSANAAVGTLTIGNLDAGSQVVSTDDSTAILIGAGGTGSQWATGTLNLNGGSLTITTGGTGIGGDMANNANNVSVLNLNGVTLKAGTNSATFINGLSSANVLSNGVAIDDGGYTVMIPQALLAGDTNNGGLTKTGTGTLTITGSNTYTGDTTINSGTMLINGSIVSNAVVTIGKLGGTGTIGGSVTVDAGGTLEPGASGVGTLTITGDLTLNGNLAFALDKSLASSNSLCVVSGTPNNAGAGTLTITNLGSPLAVGDKFTLFSKPLLNGNLLTLIPPNGVTFTNNLAEDGSIQVLTASEIASNPTNITVNVSGNTMTLSWPADHLGWVAQSNSVSLTTVSNWFDVPNSQNGTNLVITLDPSLKNVFYRLRNP